MGGIVELAHCRKAQSPLRLVELARLCTSSPVYLTQLINHVPVIIIDENLLLEIYFPPIIPQSQMIWNHETRS